MKAVDTSVVVAAFASWHVGHEAARRALDGGPRLIDHCALESYSVLTRLPPPHRAPMELAREFLATRFPNPFLRLNDQNFREFMAGLTDHGITGGSTYDALIAATAAAHGAELVTCDQRALPIYESYGILVKLVG